MIMTKINLCEDRITLSDMCFYSMRYSGYRKFVGIMNEFPFFRKHRVFLRGTKTYITYGTEDITYIVNLNKTYELNTKSVKKQK